MTSHEIQSRQIEQVSSVLVNIGLRAIKRNPIKVTSYLVGLLICLFYNGIKVSPVSYANYSELIRTVDTVKIHEAMAAVDISYHAYTRNKGWFSCNKQCQSYYQNYKDDLDQLHQIRRIEDAKERDAKSKLGLFSEYGVTETRELFWEKFAFGKEIASRQSKWDLLFLTIGSLRRDESIFEYVLRVFFNVLINITVCVCGAVVFFIFSLYSVVASYKPSWPELLAFFALASLSAVSFVLTWLLGLYVAAAGTLYVGGRVLATTIRIQDGNNYPNHRRVRREY